MNPNWVNTMSVWVISAPCNKKIPTRVYVYLKSLPLYPPPKKKNREGFYLRLPESRNPISFSLLHIASLFYTHALNLYLIKRSESNPYFYDGSNPNYNYESDILIYKF